MPSLTFLCHPEETEIIGRLLLQFIEIEYQMAECTGIVLGNKITGLKTIFKLRTDSSRIGVADSLMREPLRKINLSSEHSTAVASIKHCLKIRNQYAHCHWGDFGGLIFANYNDAAEKGRDFNPTWRRINLSLLEEQQAYFDHSWNWFQHLRHEYLVRSQKLQMNPFPKPKGRKPPNLHMPLVEGKPPETETGP